VPQTEVLAAIAEIDFEGPLVIESSTTELREIAKATRPMTRRAASSRVRAPASAVNRSPARVRPP
jgi:hypothetical protein